MCHTLTHFTVCDIIRNGVGTTIGLTSLTRHLRRGNTIATRVVAVCGGHVLANGTTSFKVAEPRIAHGSIVGNVGRRRVHCADKYGNDAWNWPRVHNGFPARLDPNHAGGLHNAQAPEIGPARLDPDSARFN